MSDAVAFIVNVGRAALTTGGTAAGQSTIQALASTALNYAARAALAYGTTYVANALRPDAPTPEQARTPFRASRPVRKTGTGRCRIAGPYMCFEVDQVDNEDSVDVFALHDGYVDAFEQWWLNDDAVTVNGGTSIVDEIGVKYRNQCVEMRWRNGTTTETYYSQATAILGSGVWPVDARGDGIASLYMRCNAPAPENFTKRFPNGLPSPSVTARLSWVYDPRNATHVVSNPFSWSWNANPVLGLLFYLCFAEGGMGLDYSTHVLPVVAHWIRAADICDEQVALKAGGTEDRYSHGVTWDWDSPPSAVIAAYIDCFDGWLTTDGEGHIIVHAGKLYPPAVVLTEKHIFGHSLQIGQEYENQIEALIVSFSSPDHKYNVVETDPWPTQDALTTAGSDRSAPFTVGGVQSNGQIRRLAKRKYLRERAPVRGQLLVDTLPDDGTRFHGERFLRVRLPTTEPQALWDAWIEVEKIEDDLESGISTIDWVAVDPTTDDWDAAAEEGDGPGAV